MPPYFVDEIRGYLRCGIFAHGFVRCHCDHCGHDLLVAFSCKNRGICPSCSARRMCNSAAQLTDRVLPNVPLRQWVLSLPFELRRLVAFRADALTAVSRILYEVVARDYRRRSGLLSAHTGAITCVQRFGGSLNLNPHLHVLWLDGVFTFDGSVPRFHEALPRSQRELAMVAARLHDRVVKWLRRKGLLDDGTGNGVAKTHYPLLSHERQCDAGARTIVVTASAKHDSARPLHLDPYHRPINRDPL